MTQRTIDTYDSVMSEMERSEPRRDSRTGRYVALIVGTTVICVLLAMIVAGPHIMSSTQATAGQLFAVAAGIAYGLVLVVRSRGSQVALERAYSGHLEELSQRLRNMAYRDAVTGLYNHRYFREQLTHEVERAARYGEPVALILLDMDNFKEINDRYGHFMGDRFLGLVGEMIARHVRASDVGARYGGDEFAVILPSTTEDEALATAQKLAFAVETAAAMTANGETVQLGISAGVAACPAHARTPSELIERADEKLYQNKASRREARAVRRGVA